MGSKLEFMRLTSVEPFWLVKNGILHSYPSLNVDIETDIVIIGAGITGSLIAHQCIADGYKTVIVDKREVCHGSTSATTSMLQYEIDKPLFELIDMIGEKGAVLSYKACFDSIDQLQKISKSIKSTCGFTKKESLYFASRKKDVSWLKQEFEARKKHGFPVKWLEAKAIEKQYQLENSHGGILSDQTIINYSGNNLKLASLGDLANPNIEPGTMLIIPGGKGQYSDWRIPRITREDPATALNVGPGACPESYDGVLGTLNFTWPVSSRTLSGYDYAPSANHYGIDIGGQIGDPVFTVDNGVVVYAGWNDWGYGNMVVVDHGQGWQSLYAHMSTVDVVCGQEVYRGDVVGTVGETGMALGPHLHFELRNDEYGRVNPWDFLQ